MEAGLGAAFWLRLSALALLLAAGPARADDQHYQDYPVGNRAAGLGGAFGAIANDPSGLYYNPAGIVDATRNNLSVSTSLYGVDSSSPQGLAGVDISHLTLNVIPSEVGSTNLIGAVPPGGQAKAAWGLDFVVPSSRNITSQSANGASTATSSLTDQTFWIGAGAAYRLSRQWSIGLSVFYLHRDVNLSETENGVTTSTGYLDQTTTLDAYDDSILGNLGIHFQLDSHWAFGLTIQTPSIYVRSGGQAEVTRISWGAGGSAPQQQTISADTATNPNAIKLESRTNGGFRLAGAYILERKLTFTVDVTGWLPVTYTRIQFQDAELQSSIPLPVQVTRLATFNVNVGLEWLITQHISVAGGFYTDRSSTPAVQVDAEGHVIDGRDALPHVDLYGGTIAAGYYGEHSLTRVGATFATGVGDNVVYDASQQAWLRQTMRQTFGYAFVASTFRY